MPLTSALLRGQSMLRTPPCHPPHATSQIARCWRSWRRDTRSIPVSHAAISTRATCFSWATPAPVAGLLSTAEATVPAGAREYHSACPARLGKSPVSHSLANKSYHKAGVTSRPQPPKCSLPFFRELQTTADRWHSTQATSLSANPVKPSLRKGSNSLGLAVGRRDLALNTLTPRSYSTTTSPEMYTASFAFFEAIWEAGVTHCFVNLGSDHPSIIEAMVKGQKEKKGKFPRIITCPNEMVAMSMADGYARLTGKPQVVIVHVDVGTQGLGAAVHNASTGRAPLLVFAGLSPFTLEGEMRGSRTEYIHWIQDVPDQKQIIGQYCRYSAEIKTGRNIKQMVNRALQFATSDPQGPVYLVGAREVMEEEIEPYHLKQSVWDRVELGGLPQKAVSSIAEALVRAKKPLLITGYAGRNPKIPGALVDLANTVKGLRVLDTGGSDMCFPASHPAWLGLRFGVESEIKEADVIIILDCDVPWIPTQCKPSDDAEVFHIDVDPLKQMMPLHYVPAQKRFRADSLTSVEQIIAFLQSSESVKADDAVAEKAWTSLVDDHKARLEAIAAKTTVGSDDAFGVGYLCQRIKATCPADTIYAIEAVTNTAFVHDNLQPDIPLSWINCGGGGLGWSGGGALGIKLATDAEHGGTGKGKFVVQIVGDGTFLFSVPGSVYWISKRYNIPVLTIVLNNKGWNAPRKSLLLVHPDGAGSKATNEEINISFDPVPDYAGIAKAASGGDLFAARVDKASELDDVLKEAIKSVQGGQSAVLDCKVKFGC